MKFAGASRRCQNFCILPERSISAVIDQPAACREKRSRTATCNQPSGEVGDLFLIWPTRRKLPIKRPLTRLSAIAGLRLSVGRGVRLPSVLARVNRSILWGPQETPPARRSSQIRNRKRCYSRRGDRPVPRRGALDCAGDVEVRGERGARLALAGRPERRRFGGGALPNWRSKRGHRRLPIIIGRLTGEIRMVQIFVAAAFAKASWTPTLWGLEAQGAI